MTPVKDCACQGDYCICSGQKVLKDGRTMRVSMFVADSAGGATLKMSIADRAASPRYDNVRGSVYGGIPAEQYFAMRDAHLETDEAQRAMAAADHARDAYGRRITNAWRDEVPKAEAAVMADAKAQARASYEASVQRLTNAWRG